MFSYRHAFHAGNHADVLKHVVTMQLLNYLGQKETPYMYIDTHAGAGLYRLDEAYASKNAEYESGIGKLWARADLPPALAQYVALIRAMNPDGKLRYYPGSPYLANEIARADDKLRLFELHPSDYKLLQQNFRQLAQGGGRGKRVMMQHEDGFLGLKALLPPPSRRGLILIDPPYEDKNDYRRVKETLADAQKRFATGTYAIWYPVLQRNESRQLADKLKQLRFQSWLNVTLSVNTPTPDGFGLHSSGMFIVNPPWTLAASLKELMPYLVATLGCHPDARYTLDFAENVD